MPEESRMAEPAPADERILQAAMRRFAVDGLGAPLRAVARRLAQDPVLLVLEAGRVQGVVTLHDVLAHVTA